MTWNSWGVFSWNKLMIELQAEVTQRKKKELKKKTQHNQSQASWELILREQTSLWSNMVTGKWIVILTSLTKRNKNHSGDEFTISLFDIDNKCYVCMFYSGWHATYRKLFVDENFLWTKRFCHLKSSVDSRLFSTSKLQILEQLLSPLCLFSCSLGNTTQYLVLELSFI